MVERVGCHLLARRDVEPQLNAEHARCRLGHLRVERARSCGKPLCFSVVDSGLCAQMIFVDDCSPRQKRDGFDAAMRMHGEAGRVIGGVGGVERVEHQKRVEGIERFISEHAHEAHTRAVGRAMSLNLIFYASEHGTSFRLGNRRTSARRSPRAAASCLANTPTLRARAPRSPHRGHRCCRLKPQADDLRGRAPRFVPAARLPRARI